MNKLVKKLLLGLLIWVIPFITSVFVWDPVTNAPRISLNWFNALMAFTWAIAFSIALFVYFKDVKKDPAEGWKTGVLWFAELIVLDLVVLVSLFGMALADFYPLVLTYLNVVVISAAVGYIKK